MEVIVALAIYAVLALLLTEIMTLVNSTMRSTTHLNRRLAYESKFADIHDPNGGDETTITDAKVMYNGTNIGLPTTLEVEGNYPDEEAGDTKTNYHFMVINKDLIDPATRPNHAFYLRLEVDIGGNNLIHELNTIKIVAADPTKGDFNMLRGGAPFVNGDTITYTPDDLEHTTSTDLVLDFKNDDALKSLDWKQPFYLEIPLRYTQTLDRANPSANNQQLEIVVNVNMEGSLYSESNQTYPVDFAKLTLTYCTAAPFTNRSGLEDVQYYGVEGEKLNYGRTKDGLNYLGAAYILHETGKIEVENH